LKTEVNFTKNGQTGNKYYKACIYSCKPIDFGLLRLYNQDMILISGHDKLEISASFACLQGKLPSHRFSIFCVRRRHQIEPGLSCQQFRFKSYFVRIDTLNAEIIESIFAIKEAEQLVCGPVVQLFA